MQANETVPRRDLRARRRHSWAGLSLVWGPIARAGRASAPQPRLLLLFGAAVVVLVGAATALGSLSGRLADAPASSNLVAPPGQARPVGQLAASVSEQLLEDESLRRHLSDDEYQLVLQWALVKVHESAESCASASAPGDAACFNRSSDQLIGLLRDIDLTIGERALVAPGVMIDRLRRLESAVEPPLFKQGAVTSTRGRLEALRSESTEWLQSTDSQVLMPRILDALH